ncbi:putative alpha-L-fucosidase [Exidia glandulosa HHB12029]|uniref:alpha-L-fucosidase n=1 Tax=Exidia glandulosa HHB12029 TaxID=1314781 RepID=A0A165FCQ3_EXIGL|nr:putative alpha-L-fucosidase [Exidia glandulosa HHB12029]
MLTPQSLVPLALVASLSLAVSVPRADAPAPAPQLEISAASLTSKWIEGSDFVQIIEATIANTGNTTWLTRADDLQVTVSSDSVVTVSPGTLQRLQPTETAAVRIGVKNKAGVNPGTTCDVTLEASWAGGTTNFDISGPCGIGKFTATEGSLETHSTPDWFDDAKYGIFIHWGLYSAPAYGSITPNEEYSEWYWQHLNNPDDATQTFQYHKETYGTNFNYDDFVANFTGKKFDPKAWMQLISDAGAKYVVPVTKHHDGFALFNFPESISKRSSVHMGPKRDFIKELLDTAKSQFPDIHRGTYFSMPEWYNPAYARYSDGGSFQGGPPVNPYTGEEIPYTGYVEVGDFVTGIQRPQMDVLAYEYETEIMWCDIGGANNSTLMASAWLNWARDKGRQVTFNSRCGIRGDYDTPEYSSNSGIVERKWETCRGLDPFSFGYNYVTPDDGYLTSEEIVQTLVDIVSKNGNFLLDIGPKNDGTIPQIMETNLLGAGKWITAHAESIFGTRYWTRSPGTDNVRFTTTPDAFYIHLFAAPTGAVAINFPLPLREGDKVTIVGGKLAGKDASLTKNSDGTFTLAGSTAIAAADQFAWTFKIAYES